MLNVIESGTTPLFLLLDQLSDVRNFGAIIRTAECIEVNGIIIQKKSWDPEIANYDGVTKQYYNVDYGFYAKQSLYSMSIQLKLKKNVIRRNLFIKVASYNKTSLLL